MARDEAAKLLQSSLANSRGAGCLFEPGSESAIAALFNFRGTQPDEVAVFFHPFQGVKIPGSRRLTGLHYGEPKQYAKYDNGTWNGLLATWNANGQREFWGNYAAGRRHGLCCLFNNDVLEAVLECTRDKINAVHLINSNQVAESLTDMDQASEHDGAGPVLKRIDAIQKRLKADNHEFCERVKKEVHQQIGAINKQRRDDINARSRDRDLRWKAGIDGIKRAAGAP
jgi:hypothetical protein